MFNSNKPSLFGSSTSSPNVNSFGLALSHQSLLGSNITSPNLDDLVSKIIETDEDDEDTLKYNLFGSGFGFANAFYCGGDNANNYIGSHLKNNQKAKQCFYNVSGSSFLPKRDFPSSNQANVSTPYQMLNERLSSNSNNFQLPFASQNNYIGNPMDKPELSLMSSSSSSSLDMKMMQQQIRSIRARPSQPDMGPVSKYHFEIERCYEQLKLLEKDRKKIENELIQLFPDHKISSANNIPIQRPPPKPSKIDRLINDMLKVHAKLFTLISIMEQLRKDHELSPYVHESIQMWLEAIHNLRMNKEELLTSKTLNGNVISNQLNESAMDQITQIIANICSKIRIVRTTLWCSHITTIYYS